MNNTAQKIITAQQVENKQNLRSYHHNITSQIYSGKRLLDIVFSSIGMVAFMVLYPFIALGIKLSTRGSVLFKQPRTGYMGKVFYCYKFRTMHIMSKRRANGTPDITKPGDTRIFTFGKFLRKTNLDELPQMFNVMKGEMSLVGPRPYPIEECSYWGDIFDDHYYRYTAHPGLTGYAQVKGYRGGTLKVDSMRERLNYDLIYTKKLNIFLDLKIIAQTVFQMIFRKTNGH